MLDERAWRRVRARAAGLRVTAVLADAACGDVTVFRDALHRLHLPYAENPSLTSCRPRCPIGRYTGHGTSGRIGESQEVRRSMKKSVMWCLIGLLSLGSAAVSQAQQTGEIEKAIAALEQQWLQSQKTNNPDLVAPLLADRFVSTGIDGKVMNKAESLADAKATKYDSMDYQDVKVTVFGDTAIATGGSKAKGTDAAGKPMDSHVRWTDTWVKMPGGKWQCVASHVSPVKK